MLFLVEFSLELSIVVMDSSVKMLRFFQFFLDLCVDRYICFEIKKNETVDFDVQLLKKKKFQKSKKSEFCITGIEV